MSGGSAAEGDCAFNLKNLWKPMILGELEVSQAHLSSEC